MFINIYKRFGGLTHFSVALSRNRRGKIFPLCYLRLFVDKKKTVICKCNCVVFIVMNIFITFRNLNEEFSTYNFLWDCKRTSLHKTRNFPFIFRTITWELKLRKKSWQRSVIHVLTYNKIKNMMYKEIK